MKKKKDKKKPRETVISPSFGQHVEIAGLDLTDGVFSFLDSNGDRLAPETVAIGQAYRRDSGKLKVINQVEVSGSNINLNPNKRLPHYDWLFAIDTNKKVLNGISIAIASSAFVTVKIKDSYIAGEETKEDWEANLLIQDAYVFSNPKINPELIGWQELINRITRTGEYNDQLKIGIIVDSELNDLRKINRREKALLDESYLPHNFELIYASTDVGREYPHNKSLSICDTAANNAWNYLIQNPKIIENMLKDTNKYVDSGVIIKSRLMQKLYNKEKAPSYHQTDFFIDVEE